MNKLVNPYIGPKTFEKTDRDRFFGRERETRELLTLTVSEQLILFYAQSGAGKSSLVNTCLVPDLERKGFKVLPIGRIGGDPQPELNVDNLYVFNLISKLATNDVNITSLAHLSLCEFLTENKYYISSEALLKEEKSDHKRIVLIIDQFEELFSTHPEQWEKHKDFFGQLAQAMQEIPHLWVVLVMREDYIASLEPYEHILPGRLRMRYYMQRLSREAALKAVKEPVKGEEFSRPYAEGVAEKLVDDLRSMKVASPDGRFESRLGQFVEPLILQVICYDIWKNLPPGGTYITEDDLQLVGDVNEFLKSYYARRMAEVADISGVKERKIRKWFVEELISPTGVRNMVLLDSNESNQGINDKVIRALSDLVSAEQRGGSTFYELTHDRLIEPILSENKEWEANNTSFLQSRASLWEKQGRSDGLLLRRQELRDAEAWAETNKDEITEDEQLFLEACRNARKTAQAEALANQRLQSAFRTSVIIAIVALLLLAVSTLLGIQSFQNQRLTQMRALMGASSEALNNNDDNLATLLAYQALVNYGQNHGEVEQALGNIVQRQMGKKGVATIPFAIFNKDRKVNAVSISPDSKFIVSGYSDGTLVIWDGQTYKFISQPAIAHVSPVTSIAFSPKGNIMASASEDKLILWNTSNPTNLMEISQLKEHKGAINTIAFSTDGNTLVSASYDQTVILWDVSDPAHPINRKTLSGHSDVVWGVAFSPDGKTLATSSWDDTVILWDIRNLTDPVLIQKLQKHTADVESIAFSPNGKILASVSDDNTIILWDTQNYRPYSQPLTGHSNYVRYVTFSHDGSKLVSQSDDNQMYLWDVRDPTKPQELSHFDGTNYSFLGTDIGNVAFSRNDKEIIAGNGDAVGVWDVRNPGSPNLLKSLVVKADEVPGSSFANFMSLTRESKALVTVNQNQAVSLWDISNPTPRKLAGLHELSSVHTAALSPDEKYVVTGGEDGKVNIWEMATGKLISRMTHGQQTVNAVAFSPDGKFVASGGADGKVKVWVIQTGSEKFHASTSFFGEITSVAFSPKGKYVAAGDISGAVKIWEASTGKLKTRIHEAGPAQVNTVAFSPDESRIVIAFDQDSTVELWDVETQQRILAISNGKLKTLNYSVAGLFNLIDRKENEVSKNVDQPGQSSRIADVEFEANNLVILYENGVIDHWQLWPSRAELIKYAQKECDDCSLTYEQRVEYHIYNLVMQITNYAGLLITIGNLLLYSLCILIIYRSVFLKPVHQERKEGFTFGKFISAMTQGGILITASLLIFIVIVTLEMKYFNASTFRLPSTILWPLLLTLPLGLWAGGAYSYRTRWQKGSSNGIVRSLAAFFTGLLSGSMAGFICTVVFCLIIVGFSSTFSDEIISTIVYSIFGFVVGSILGGVMGFISVMGAFIYMFWLNPWSERRRLRVQQELDF